MTEATISLKKMEKLYADCATDPAEMVYIPGMGLFSTRNPRNQRRSRMKWPWRKKPKNAYRGWSVLDELYPTALTKRPEERLGLLELQMQSLVEECDFCHAWVPVSRGSYVPDRSRWICNSCKAEIRKKAKK